VPAAAVIPAPRAYINVVAVRTPVVGFETIPVDSGLPWALVVHGRCQHHIMVSV